METRVLIRSSRKPNAVNPPPQWCFWWNLIMIGQLVSEILMFESVDGRTHRRMHGRRLGSHTISSPWAFCSGELKNKIHKLNELTYQKRMGPIATRISFYPDGGHGWLDKLCWSWYKQTSSADFTHIGRYKVWCYILQIQESQDKFDEFISPDEGLFERNM